MARDIVVKAVMFRAGDCLGSGWGRCGRAMYKISCANATLRRPIAARKQSAVKALLEILWPAYVAPWSAPRWQRSLSLTGMTRPAIKGGRRRASELSRIEAVCCTGNAIGCSMCLGSSGQTAPFTLFGRSGGIHESFSRHRGNSGRHQPDSVPPVSPNRFGPAIRSGRPAIPACCLTIHLTRVVTGLPCASVSGGPLVNAAGRGDLDRAEA